MNKAVQLVESLFLLNLVLVGGSGILVESAKHVVYTSIAVGFFALCGLIDWNILTQIHYKIRRFKAERELIESLNQEVKDFSNSEPLLSKTIVPIQ